METSYRSVACNAQSKIEIKKSVFIGDAVYVSDKDSAESFVASVKKAHTDARHVCFAYLLKNGDMKMSDDGEPQGTAGLPMLEIIKKSGICNVAVTVTRYFGDILLGAPGLVRAYSSACAEALKAAGVCEYMLTDNTGVTLDYGDYPKAENEIRKLGGLLSNPVFSEKVGFVFSSLPDVTDTVIAAINELSAGKAKIERLEMTWNKKI